MGYVILNNVLPWFHPKASDMEYEDYAQMLKKVCFSSIYDCICVELLFSLGRGPIALMETTLQSSKALSLIGSIVNSNLIRQSITRISTAVDLLMMRAVNYSVQLSWTGTTQCKLNGTRDLIMPHLLAASVRAGIRDRADGYIVTEMSWPTFLYEKYTADQDKLEEGLFKSAILIQVHRTQVTR
jgi:hypothetical protein